MTAQTPNATDALSPLGDTASAADVPVRSALPTRTPGAAPAIADSAITGSAITRPQPPATGYEHLDTAVHQQTAERLHYLFEQMQAPAPAPDLSYHDPVGHPLTSPDLAFRYSKEQPTGFNRGLRNAYAKGALSDLSDTDLGLVTVPKVDLYAAVAADLGYDPLG